MSLEDVTNPQLPDRCNAAIDQVEGAGHFAVDFSGLERSIDDACLLIDNLRAERAVMLQLLREALDAFENRDSVINVRDWVTSARAAIARVEGRS